MTLSARLAKLEGLVPRRRPGLPMDPVELLKGLATGRFTAADIDRTDPDLMSLLATVVAILVERGASSG